MDDKSTDDVMRELGHTRQVVALLAAGLLAALERIQVLENPAESYAITANALAVRERLQHAGFDSYLPQIGAAELASLCELASKSLDGEMTPR